MSRWYSRNRKKKPFPAPEPEGLLVIGEDTVKNHGCFFGSSGIGKSAIGSQFQKGMPDHPDFQSGQQHDVPQQGWDDMGNGRENSFAAVKIAYWESLNPEDTDALCDTMTHFIPELRDVDITDEQKKALYMMLPQAIIGTATKWGLDDSVVRDDIYVFVESNISEVRLALGLPDK